VAGGAAGMVGASLLAAHAAALAGAGRVLVHTHASDAGGALPVDVRHPELMLRPMAELQATLRDNRKATVVAGCGGGDAVAAELPGCLAHAARLVEPSEVALLKALEAKQPAIDQALSRDEYEVAMRELGDLSAPVDRFFTDVLVMAEDPSVRQARLALLTFLRRTILNIADIAEVAPEQS